MWRAGKISDALAGDWPAVRTTRPRQMQGWETEFADSQMSAGVKPHEAIHNHFAAIFASDTEVPAPPFDGYADSPGFTREELLAAVHRAKDGKSVGMDETSAELFKHPVQNETTATALVRWYSSILHSGRLPEDWGKAIMIVLPKIPAPQQPKDLRPISMGSTASKIFSRMLLRRAEQVMQPMTPVQCASQRRRTNDYLFTIACTFDLEREWRGGGGVVAAGHQPCLR